MSAPTAPIRVLIADDAADIRMLLRLSLSRDGRFEVVGEAADGAEASSLSAIEKPDAVVLDLSMPVMDGLQAAAEIRNRLPAVKILVLSGFTAERMSAKALACGADRYLEKGSDVKELADTIAELCGRPSEAEVGFAEAQPVQATPLEEPVLAGAKAGREGAAAPGEVMSFMSHELQTPLTALKGFAAVLKAGIDLMDREQIIASADAIERSADNLSALARSFADARAIEAGLLCLLRRSVPLDRLVEETVGDLSTITRPHPVVVRTRGDIEVSGDPVRLRQVVTNLVSNAAKFSPADSPIEVEVWASGGIAAVSIVDHGPGVPESREDELFGKFARLDSSTKGTGLGLYISRGIARAHGGDLTHHRSPSGGARFLLELPLARPAA